MDASSLSRVNLYSIWECFVNDPKQYLELNILLNITWNCGGDMGDWLGPLSNSIMMALIPLCLLPWCQCAHTKPDPTHPISYWTVIYISTALCPGCAWEKFKCWQDTRLGTGLITALDGPYCSLLMFPVLTCNDTLSQGGATHQALTRH